MIKSMLKRGFLSLFVLWMMGFHSSALAQKGQLIVFLSDPEHPVIQDFAGNYLTKYKALAEAQQLEWKVVDVTKGAPELVAFTPAIVFQNHLGRSLYIGRYAYIDKVKTFIRAVRRLPQAPTPNEKHDVMVRQTGRLTLVNPVKITNLAGALPSRLDQGKFVAEALAALDEGMQAYRYQEKFDAMRNHRLVYTAFYPYRSDDGRLFVSAEMYSQFNCITPVFRKFDQPFQGSWRNWKDVFRQAGAFMEARIDSFFIGAGGDGLIPLPASAPVRTWEELGLALPKAESGQAVTAFQVPEKLPLKWELAGPVEKDLPMVAFAFPPPLDYYAGEMTAFQGGLELGEGADITKAAGVFSVDMKSLSMGDPELDGAVQGMLKMLEFPQSSFRLHAIDRFENPNLRFGFTTQFLAQGLFLFMGIEAPLQVEATMEPVMDDAGQPRLMVNAQFQIQLRERYGVKGPDGPDDAKDRVLFNLNFLLKPRA